jgi:predicted dehydrogenase
MIDQILWNFGTPQLVYSLHTSAAGDKQQRLYLTEDTALVTMKFTDTLVGNLIASRCIAAEPQPELLRLYGDNNILTVRERGFSATDAMGRVTEECQCDGEPLVPVRRVLENFALSVLWPDKNRLCGSGRENLNVMAVVEAAYLSGRTAMPEEPGRILQRAGLEATTAEPGQA